MTLTNSTAMLLERTGGPLRCVLRAVPEPEPHEVVLSVKACGVCRTDLHVYDGDLPTPSLPLVLGHEIVGEVVQTGSAVNSLAAGDRVGVPWLGAVCGSCRYCLAGQENLCDRPVFTGYSKDGGYAEHTVASADFCVPLPDTWGDEQTAPLLCGGLIGWRCLRMVGECEAIGIYGFGAAAHILTQVASRRGVRVYAFTRPGDVQRQEFARSLGACWSGDAGEAPPVMLDASIIFAPAGELVPIALAGVRKGGCVVAGGIHMTPIPSFSYDLLWGERCLRSVANLTRQDAAEFFRIIQPLKLDLATTRYPLTRADDALADLRAGRLQGAAVVVPGE